MNTTPQQNTEAKQEASMEEILQSIRDIIAEEGDEPKTTATQVGSAMVDTAANEVPGSEVLELTEALPDDVPVAQAAMMPDPIKSDVLDQIDQALAPRADPVAVHTTAANSNTLLSPHVAKASASAMKKIPREKTSPAFRSGETVEDLAMEALKPMLKTWLDANLPSIVERLVEREIRKLVD